MGYFQQSPLLTAMMSQPAPPDPTVQAGNVGASMGNGYPSSQSPLFGIGERALIKSLSNNIFGGGSAADAAAGSAGADLGLDAGAAGAAGLAGDAAATDLAGTAAAGSVAADMGGAAAAGEGAAAAGEGAMDFLPFLAALFA